jgi:hypothetical protein
VVYGIFLIDADFQSAYYLRTMYAGQRFTTFTYAAFAYPAAAQDRRASAQS